MSKRYENFDYLRGLAIIGVILIHITTPLASSSDVWGWLFNQLFRFAVPVFFLLSGWGLVISNSYEKSISYTEFINKRLLKVLPPYFIWNVIYVLYRNLLTLFTENKPISALDFIKGVFVGTNYNHLYFIPLIVLFYLLYPFLMKIGKSNIGVLLSLIITILSHLAYQITGHKIFNVPQNIFNWLFYFIFGIWLANNFETKVKNIMEHRKEIIVVFITSLTLVFAGSYYSLFSNEISTIITTSMRPSVIPYSIFFTFLIIAFKPKISKTKRVLNIYSKYSFEIYLSHQLFVSLLQNLYSILDFQINSLIYIILMFIMVTLFSLGVAIIQKKILLAI